MGQTLTHGVYLPDEGERNCYNGLAANWQLLDTSVGTIAEHTSALAGKAPLVHTHSKSDVTDLFNSANTWSGDNTFSKTVGFTKVNATTLYAQNSRVELGDSGLSGDSYNQISFWDKNSDNLSYLRQTYTTDGTNAFNIFVRNKFLNGVPNTAGTVDYAYFGLTLNADKSKEGILRASFRPYDNNTYDLGSSSYQWNNLYAKNYYYDGVAWGLDKANVWSGEQTYTQSIKFKVTYTIGTVPSSELYSGFNFGNSGTNLGNVTARVSNSGATYTRLYIGNKFTDGALDPNGTWKYAELQVGLRANGDRFIYTDCLWRNSLTPYDSNLNLGTSTNKWKSLNGINPGALSFPNYSDTTYIDISGSIVPPTGETEINKNLGFNEYTPPIDGWLSIRCDGATFLQIYRNSYNCPGITSCDPSGGKLVVTLPVRKNVTYTIRIKTSGTSNLYQLYPCQGNV